MHKKYQTMQIRNVENEINFFISGLYGDTNRVSKNNPTLDGGIV